MANTASKTIEFNSPESLSSSDSLSISLDEDYNNSVYGEDSKTTFVPGETAYLKVIPSASYSAYELSSSAGVIGVLNPGVPYDIEEYLDFTKEDNASLSSLPIGAVTWSWIGKNPGNPVFSEQTVKIPAAATARLKCTYQTLGDRVQLTNTFLDLDEYEIVCCADSSSCNVDFGSDSDEDDETEVNIEILVQDVCSEEPIPNASVVIPGLYSGTTNSEGILTVPQKVISGTEYAIKVTATGYTDSDKDYLNNDIFIVPEGSDTTEG